MMARRGATLVELIASICVLGVAVPPMMVVVSTALEHQGDSLARQRALHLGEAVMETVLADAFAGSDSIDMADAGYSGSVASRLGDLDAFYGGLGYEWKVVVGDLADATGVATGTNADLFRRVTTTVRFTAGRDDEQTEVSLWALVTEFPPSDGVVRGPHPLGWRPQHSMLGIQGVPKVSAHWFAVDDGASVRTNWANRPISYTQDLGLTPATWHVGVTVTNFGSLPLASNYSNFKVEVRVNGSSIGQVNIPASHTEWNTIWVDLGARSGVTKVELIWKNDSYKAGSYDANIQIGAVEFAKAPGGTP